MDSRPLVAFDESGNTGEDLLNIEQPVFTLASTCISEESSLQLLSGLSQSEVKFGKIKRSKPGRRFLKSFFESGVITPQNSKISVFHKGYMVIAKAVDLLLEEWYMRHGADLYEQGANLAFTNLHFYVMPVLCGEEAAFKFKNLFVTMIRERTPSSIDEFYLHVTAMIDNCNHREYIDALKMLWSTSIFIQDVIHGDTYKLDPAIPAFIQHCDEWSKELKEEFDVIHDNSKSVSSYEELLKAYMNKEEPDVEIGYDRRKFVVPFKSTGVDFADSKSIPQIQIADILSGSFSYWSKGLLSDESKDDELWQMLNDSSIVRFMCGNVWPSQSFTPEELNTTERGGINPADYAAGMIHRYNNS